MFVEDIIPSIILLFFSSALPTIASTINSGDFVFPLEKSHDFSMCTFENGTTGKCVNVSQCPKAQDDYRFGINPTLCHFVKNEPVVCCLFPTDYPPTTDYTDNLRNNNSFANKIENTTLRPLFDPWRDEFVIISSSPTVVKNSMQGPPSQQLNERRKSVASCEDVYSLPAPFESVPGEFHITIVGGQNTEEGEFPHMAALGWTDEKSNVEWRCGGTLISHDYVLTAGHCVIGRTPPDIVRVGEKDLIDVDTLKTPQDFAIELIIGHPQYQPNQLYNDIALIKLNSSATISVKVRPACLWQGNSINFTDVTATGYGHTEFGGKSSSKLLKVDLKIFNNDECEKGYKNEKSLKNGIIESQLCAGDSKGEMDTCQGDSGGPIVVSTKNDDQIVYHVVGVTSFGKACATTLPGVYTRVSHYLDWIENIVWQ